MGVVILVLLSLDPAVERVLGQNKSTSTATTAIKGNQILSDVQNHPHPPLRLYRNNNQAQGERQKKRAEKQSQQWRKGEERKRDERIKEKTNK